MQAATAADGIKALPVCRQEHPGRVLLNWSMPNGLDCLEAIRQNFGDQAPPMVLRTMRDDPAHSVPAIEAGAGELVTRPFDFDVLPGKPDQVTTGLDAGS